ncbi:MAG TPA: rRNA maturation RNase YbeY [Solirubrobacteraceae bacterium]|nr:rRNA maturation RNase YbeY [Solirubrobacteraceae bacterium]
MLEVEVLGEQPAEGPSHDEVERLCALALASAGIDSGHLAVEFVSVARITELNAAHRRKEGPTDVLSFPIDGVELLYVASPDVSQPAQELFETSPGDAAMSAAPPRELGDIVICAEHTADLREAIVHGALHLVGMDHETDDGEMLALQAELLRGA